MPLRASQNVCVRITARLPCQSAQSLQFSQISILEDGQRSRAIALQYGDWGRDRPGDPPESLIKNKPRGKCEISINGLI